MLRRTSIRCASSCPCRRRHHGTRRASAAHGFNRHTMDGLQLPPLPRLQSSLRARYTSGFSPMMPTRSGAPTCLRPRNSLRCLRPPPWPRSDLRKSDCCLEPLLCSNGTLRLCCPLSLAQAHASLPSTPCTWPAHAVATSTRRCSLTPRNSPLPSPVCPIWTWIWGSAEPDSWILRRLQALQSLGTL